MTEPTFIGIALAAVSALGVISGGLFIVFSWLFTVVTIASAVLDKSWSTQDWGLPKMLGLGGLISIAIGSAAAWAVHLFKLMPTI